MSFTTKLGDEFLRVPKLDVSGKDWPLWKGQLELSLSARGLMGHLTGTALKPKNPGERECGMAREGCLKALFEKWSLVVGVELWRQLGEMRLKESGDAREHLETMMGIHEQLASMGKPVTDEDLFNMIFVSLPWSADDLMGLILDEYDRLKLQLGAKSNAKGEDAAYSTDDKARGKAQSRSPMTCFNCGWEGHKKENCWEEGGGKENEAPERWKPRGKKDKASKDETPKSDSVKANTATEKYEPDAVWLAMAADAGEIDDWLVEDEEDTLEITAPQLQAQEDIVKAPDSTALSQSCTAAERAIVERSVSFERQGGTALSRNLLIAGEREPVGNNQHQDPEMMWGGPDTIEEVPIRPMAMPIDFDPWRCQNEPPIPAVHTAELGQPPFKHTTTIFTCERI